MKTIFCVLLFYVSPWFFSSLIFQLLKLQKVLLDNFYISFSCIFFFHFLSGMILALGILSMLFLEKELDKRLLRSNRICAISILMIPCVYFILLISLHLHIQNRVFLNYLLTDATTICALSTFFTFFSVRLLFKIKEKKTVLRK